MASYTAKERWIARQLEVSDAGLAALLRIARGDGVSGGTAGERLERQGLVTAGGWFQPNVYTQRQITEKGKARLDEARRMGY